MSKFRKLLSPTYRRKKGFTLIELLVVIAIIGILAVLIIVALNVARRKANEAKVKEACNAIAKAEEMYRDDNNTYTDNIGQLDVTLQDPVDEGTGDYDVEVTNATTDNYQLRGYSTGGNVIFHCSSQGCGNGNF